jgi:hypothetical protein
MNINHVVKSLYFWRFCRRRAARGATWRSSIKQYDFPPSSPRPGKTFLVLKEFLPSTIFLGCQAKISLIREPR